LARQAGTFIKEEASMHSAIERRRALLLMTLAFGTFIAPAAAQNTQPYFKDKTIHMIVGSAPGGGYDAYGRLISEHLRQHIPGSPTVVVQNMPGAGSLIATNYIANVAPKDGTYIGAVNGLTATDLLIYPERTKFDPRLLQWIGSALRENHVGVVRSDSAVKTFDDVFKQELIISGTGGATNAYPTLTNAVLGTKFKVVSGYQGTAAGLLAVERKEVDGNVGITWASVKATQTAQIRDGKLKVFIQFGLKKHKELPDVPWIFDYAKTAADRAALNLVLSNQEFGRPFIAPQGTPADVVAILRKAFDEVMADPEFLADAAKRNLEIDATTGGEIQSLIDQIYKTPADVVERVKPILESIGQ
jgi:tripartite-type tricarboxylate transporter receptor subunit TctC